jgi:hypothetical protein
MLLVGKHVDTQLEIAMQDPELKSYLNEEVVPEFKQINSTILEQIKNFPYPKSRGVRRKIQTKHLLFSNSC